MALEHFEISKVGSSVMLTKPTKPNNYNDSGTCYLYNASSFIMIQKHVSTLRNLLVPNFFPTKKEVIVFHFLVLKHVKML
jgi:hypothetical protein